MTKHTQAIRKTVVIRIEVNHGDDSGPLSFVSGKPDIMEHKEAWWVTMSTQSGLLPEDMSLRMFYSEHEAKSFAGQHAVGTEIYETFSTRNWVGKEAKRHEYIRSRMDDNDIPNTGRSAEEDSFLAFSVLSEAGIIHGAHASQKVLSTLGAQRIGELKNKHGENWEVAAEFEYCWLNLPASSPAYIAAAHRFHYYITHDDFAAGYLLRDLECLVHGVEAAAVKSFEMRKNAGAAGSKKSAQARAARRCALMDAMEVVAKRSPDVVKLGSKVVADLSLSDCIDDSPALWSQGQGQIDDYLGEIRRGEAGQELQSRFRTLFPEKPPKRLRS